MKDCFLLCCLGVCFIVQLFWLLPLGYSSSETINRCLAYRSLVMREANYNIGLDAPVTEFIGQIQTESNCKEGITSFDQGRGLGQFMDSTAKWLQEMEPSLRELSDAPSPYDPKWAIRGMILYDKRLKESSTCKEWYFAYRAYNGGVGLLNKEIKRANSCEPSIVAKACQRKKINFDWGILDFCKVNIEYPDKIKKAAKNYVPYFLKENKNVSSTTKKSDNFSIDSSSINNDSSLLYKFFEPFRSRSKNKAKEYRTCS